MSSKKNGGYAFPRAAVSDFKNINDGGMTLRDWFAGQALAGMMASDKCAEFQKHLYSDRLDVGRGVFARACYDHADAMLAAREDAK